MPCSSLPSQVKWCRPRLKRLWSTRRRTSLPLESTIVTVIAVPAEQPELDQRLRLGALADRREHLGDLGRRDRPLLELEPLADREGRGRAGEQRQDESGRQQAEAGHRAARIPLPRSTQAGRSRRRPRARRSGRGFWTSDAWLASGMVTRVTLGQASRRRRSSAVSPVSPWSPKLTQAGTPDSQSGPASEPCRSRYWSLAHLRAHEARVVVLQVGDEGVPAGRGRHLLLHRRPDHLQHQRVGEPSEDDREPVESPQELGLVLARERRRDQHDRPRESLRGGHLQRDVGAHAVPDDHVAAEVGGELAGALRVALDAVLLERRRARVARQRRGHEAERGQARARPAGRRTRRSSRGRPGAGERNGASCGPRSETIQPSCSAIAGRLLSGFGADARLGHGLAAAVPAACVANPAVPADVDEQRSHADAEHAPRWRCSCRERRSASARRDRERRRARSGAGCPESTATGARRAERRGSSRAAASRRCSCPRCRRPSARRPRRRGAPPRGRCPCRRPCARAAGRSRAASTRRRRRSRPTSARRRSRRRGRSAPQRRDRAS